MDAINAFLTYNLALSSENARMSAMIFIIVCIVCTVFRIIVFFGYTIAKSGYLLFAKEVAKKKEDPRRIKSIASSLSAKIIADYTAIGENGVAIIDASNIVNNHITRLGILGISYISMGEFVEKYEQASIFIGFILALMFDSAQGIGLLSVGIYVAFRVLAMVFDFNLARTRLSADITSFIEREIGCFYAGDVSSAVGRLRIEMVEAISGLAVYFETAMAGVAKTLDESIKKGMDDVANSVNFTMESLSKYTEYMDVPFEKWEKSVNNAIFAQDKLNETIDFLSANTNEFAKTQKSIEVNIAAFTMAAADQTRLIHSAASSLEQAIKTSNLNESGIEAALKSVSVQMEAFEKTKETLETALTQYEESLKEITSDISGGVGSIIGVHVQNVYADVNENLKNNIDTIVNSNNHMMKQMENFMEEIIRNQRQEQHTSRE